MDRDKIKGKAKDVLGRAERQAGEWTGNQKAQDEGLKNQVEGKVQNAWGKVKDAGKDLKKDMDRDLHGTDANRDREAAQEGDENRQVEGIDRQRRAA